ncbi:hypothetical protein LPJ66_002164 [Kickxella alabastrina]|uniref:Uncharacterized protein n=1 Tax=Kickxella alabastrina TaxID=61397 RepID=A0ACC1IR92_9FUNG|nr:hypothetical protein LPJ66_002164 [Kickxella alabastrina]
MAQPRNHPSQKSAHDHQTQHQTHHQQVSKPPPAHPAPPSSHHSHPGHARPAPSISHKNSAKELKNIRDPRLLQQAEVDKRLKSLRRRASWLDSKFSCCCGLFRFGMESLIGLIPVIGDFVGIFLALSFMNTIRRRFNVPASLVSQMTINIAIDFCVGLVPILGDIIDVMFKANMRNYELVEKYVTEQRKAAAADAHNLELGLGLDPGSGTAAHSGGFRARIGEFIPPVPLNLNAATVTKVATAGINARRGGH